MKKISLMFALVSMILNQLPGAANAALIVYPPVLDKVIINSDSMQAVLYWRLTHSAADNPVLGYAATYNGISFSSVSHSLQGSNVSTVSLPYRANAEPYTFAIAAVTKNGVGPSSNRIKMEINPYTIPLRISELSPTIGGFSFRILDFAEIGHSTSAVQISITDIEGSDSAYLRTGQNLEYVEFGGLKKGEKVLATLYKNVTNCQGFVIQTWCPYSSFKIIEGKALDYLPVPYCSLIVNEGDGFSCQLENYDSDMNYSVEAPEGVNAYVSYGGLLQVSDLSPGSSVSVKVICSYPSYDPVEILITGRSLDGASEKDANLELSETVPTHLGFFAIIRNYNSEFEYEATSSNGAVSIYGEGVVEVRGLTAKETATLTVRVLSGGEVLSESSIEGSSKPQRVKGKKK